MIIINVPDGYAPSTGTPDDDGRPLDIAVCGLLSSMPPPNTLRFLSDGPRRRIRDRKHTHRKWWK